MSNYKKTPSLMFAFNTLIKWLIWMGDIFKKLSLVQNSNSIRRFNNFVSFSDKPIAKKGTNAEVKAKRSSLNFRINSSSYCPECAQLQIAQTTSMTAYEFLFFIYFQFINIVIEFFLSYLLIFLIFHFRKTIYNHRW